MFQQNLMHAWERKEGIAGGRAGRKGKEERKRTTHPEIDEEP